MDIEDSYISDDVFRDFLKSMPQICVELVVETNKGILLCKRAVKPDLWFWPGSRLYKGEGLKTAVHRVAHEELSINVDILEQLGVHSHFWRPEQVDEAVSRHTVNVVYRVSPSHSDYCINLDDQHTDYRFVKQDISTFHEYVQEYFTTYGLAKS